MSTDRVINPLYAELALPLPVTTLFTYSVPQDLMQSAETGRRALVPFGRRILTGFIVGVSEHQNNVETSKIKAIIDILDDEPVFDLHMLNLSRWVADYYICSLGEVLKTAMPHGTMIESRIRVRALETPPQLPTPLTPLQRDLYDFIKSEKSILLKMLERRFRRTVRGTLQALEAKGLVKLDREIASPTVRPKTERHVRLSSAALPLILPRSPKQRACIEVLRQYPEGLPLAELLERFNISRGVVNAVTDAGLAVYDEIEITRTSALLEQESIKVDHTLTTAQEASIRLITRIGVSPKPKPVVLKGVTGSGKTRVYIELVKKKLSEKKGAVILVPEIALTPQTTKFFSSAFPGRVAVVHSAMSPGERFDMWRRIHEGVFPVVIGPRSAVFAPVRNLGIIIVDEEHDHSYKQTDMPPRYHARDVAVVRGNMLGIPVVLGSATPSLESWHNVSKGKYLLSILPDRVESKPLPDVRIVNMREERAQGNLSSLSRALREELDRCIENSEKSIVLINRRGFASSILCKACGYILTCPNCSVGLTYHSSKGLALCHWCGHEQLILEHCPECGEKELRRLGMGTQKIEKELVTAAGPDSVIRMDSDTTKMHDGHFKLLEEFTKGTAPILLGTQMVSKGLDIHDVTLVGIISADHSLSIPDFRASERTFQLITQVAGRSGRGETPGKVVLQTYSPENFVVQTAARQDYEHFAEYELAIRKEVAFPPFTRLVLLEISTDTKSHLTPLSEEVARFLSSHVPHGAEILGPVDAPIAKKGGRHRSHILIKYLKPHQMGPALREAAERFSSEKERITIDVDPEEMM